MTDDVFALSPISARAVQPSEADYEAIRDAFMETSRGRWFLGEYAKRNRNADTSMVLDAVARIEEVLATQRQAPPPDNRLPEALAAIRSALERATETAGAALDSASVEANLAPIRKGIVIIKEISWRWREIGADGRICDLIDSQLNAIEAGCALIAGVDPRAALNQAFDLIKSSIEQFRENAEAPAPTADEAVATAPQPAADPVMQPEPEKVEAVSTDAAVAEQFEGEQTAPPEALATDHAEAAVGEPTTAKQDAIAEQDVVRQHVPEGDVVATFCSMPDIAVDAATKSIEAGEPAAEAVIAQDDQGQDDRAQADAHDEAVLELVAAEMSAPDTVDIDDFSDAIADDIVVTMRPLEPVAVAVTQEPEPMPELAPMPVRPPIVQPFPQAVPAAASLPPSPAPLAALFPSSPAPVVTSLPPSSPVVARAVAPEPASEPSLGSTIIANGLLQPVKPPANDPLAPIRRMSQAEKIAFFS